MLTPEVKDAFLIFIHDRHGLEARLYATDRLLKKDITALWGYLLQFFDGVGIRLDVKSKWSELKTGKPILIYELFILGEVDSPWLERPEAQKAAIETACKLYSYERE